MTEPGSGPSAPEEGSDEDFAPRDAGRSAYGPLLDAMDGIAYLVEDDGTFIDWGRPNWNRFACNNGAPELASTKRFNLFEALAGDVVSQNYRTLMKRALANATGPEVFVFRCDSANEMRQFRMTISCVQYPAQSPKLLFHILPVSKTVRPPINLFDGTVRKALLGEESGKPLVRICSYCLKVHDDAQDCWIEPEAYYRAGGSGDVRLSHGICHDCYQAIIEPVSDPHERRKFRRG